MLSGIETLWIAVDHDMAGRDAARECVERWQDTEVILIQPCQADEDLNDLVKGRSDAA